MAVLQYCYCQVSICIQVYWLFESNYTVFIHCIICDFATVISGKWNLSLTSNAIVKLRF